MTETYFVACRLFRHGTWEFAARHGGSDIAGAFRTADHFLEGHGHIEWGAESADYGPAQIWLLPAALGAYHLAPVERTSFLRAYVPASLDEFARKLAEQGVSETAVSHLVHP